MSEHEFGWQVEKRYEVGETVSGEADPIWDRIIQAWRLGHEPVCVRVMVHLGSDAEAIEVPATHGFRKVEIRISMDLWMRIVRAHPDVRANLRLCGQPVEFGWA